VGAVRSLAEGHSSVLITRQSGMIVPVPFADIVDPATGRARVRQVDTTTDAYLNALALQERITTGDLEDEATLARIAAAANLTPEEAKQRYWPL
jgi:6-phosphofructokinase 1